MPLIHRPFTLGNLTTLTDQASAAASLVVVPMYSYAVSGSEMVTPEEETFDIEDGAFTGERTIVAGQVYKFTLKDSGGNTILDTGPRTVSAASTSSISFVEVYNSGTPPPDPVVAYVKEGDDANRLDYGAADDGDVWSYDGDTDVWGPSPAGAGDMLAANNLSDLTSASTARTNLGLGTAATRNAAAAGTTGGVLNADDPTTANARTPTAHKSTHATGGADALTPGDIGAALATDLSAHTANTSNPHSVTKGDVGLGSVDNTSDLSKPISTVAQTALNLKTDKATLTTKGDIYVATAAGVLTRLPAGTDGNVLIADSTQGAGLRWGAPEGGMVVVDHVVHMEAAGTNSQSLQPGAWRTRTLNAIEGEGDTGIVLGSGATANYFQLPAGTYIKIEVRAHHAYVVRHRVALRTVNLSAPSELDPANPFEFYGQAVTSGDVMYPAHTSVPTFTLTSPTWWTVESFVQAWAGGTPIDGGYAAYNAISAFKADGVTLVPEKYVEVAITRQL